ncbi:MAG: 4-(cytidine 5'-diphospho)-2-C-methyl-D-erythritol kinase [Alphaproteobacteria bacterium]|nr:4-(cytidine 5'-diphospho)-2-C-methyl-D-erythritol kinase [Alphaproteobacteria bacterium]
MRVFAPAKVNLYLHVTNKLRNGYHALDSLVMFADVGDEIEITRSDEFQFTIDGPLAHSLKGRDIDAGPQSGNLVVKAAWRLARLFDRMPDVAVRLTKNLPLGAGIGGGSADAAAVIWGLCSIWDIARDDARVVDLLASLGADVPVCFAAMSARIKGVGDVFEAVPALPELSCVLVHPGKPCGTVDVFQRYDGRFREMVALPKSFGTYETLIMLLKRCNNDLRDGAISFVPEIDNVLQALTVQDGCDLARISGSGSCCFGLFADNALAQDAAQALQDDNPDWWVRAATLGSVERY